MSNVKNDLKVKQLAKQLPTLKTLMQKILVGLWVKNFTLSILSSLKLSIPLKNVLCILKMCANYKLPVFRENFLKLKFCKLVSSF